LPLAGRRHVLVRERRTRLDFAAVIKTLCDDLCPQAEKIVLVLDQLQHPRRRQSLRGLTRLRKRDGWPSGWKSITRPGMEAG
jgi:hypothetical protein